MNWSARGNVLNPPLPEDYLHSSGVNGPFGGDTGAQRGAQRSAAGGRGPAAEAPRYPVVALGLARGKRDPAETAWRWHAGHRLRPQIVPARFLPGAAALRPYAPVPAGLGDAPGRQSHLCTREPP